MPRPLADCDYTAFISYAHADDEAWFGWVTHFRNELERGLGATLRGVRLPPLHLSAENGPVAGVLGEQLEQRIAASFAMVIVVHDSYAQSEWCLKELEYFRARFGDEGLRERLYIVAMSEPAMLGVAGGSDWQRLLPGGEQLWIPFFQPRAKDQPIPVYIGKELVNPEFGEPYLRLRSDFAAKLKRAAAASRGGPVPTGAPRPAPDDALPPAAPAPAAAALVGLVPGAGTVARLRAAVEALRARGVEVALLPQDAVFSDFAAFADARRLVLAFDDEPLAMTSLAPGGHLQLQRDAWLRKGRPASDLLWLDLRADSAAPPAPGGAAAWVAGAGPERLDAATLAARLGAAAAPASGAGGGAGRASVRVYIESNRYERNLWESLGEQIQRKWVALAAAQGSGTGPAPALGLRARGLPVDQIDAHPPLDDADGVVLLWGRKTADALIAQINKVENKIAPGRDAPPGIVAYLMPPQQASEPIPAWGWQVLRFNAPSADEIDVVAEERDELEHFLRKVLERRLEREKAGRA